MNLGLHFAKDGLNTVLLTLEMPEEHMVKNFATLLTSSQIFATDELMIEDAKTNPSYQKVNQHMAITERGNKTTTIKSICEHFDVILIDQLSFMRTQAKTDTRAQEVSAIVHELKEYAVQHNKVVLLASQINREGANHKTEVPQLHHLKESGGVEETSDVVFLMHIDEEENVLHCNIAKNRTGAKKVHYMRPHFSKCRIDELKGYNKQQDDAQSYDISKDKDFI